MSDIPVVSVVLTEEFVKENTQVVKPVRKPQPAPEPVFRKVWDNYRKIGEVQKNETNKYYVGAGIKDGVKYLHIHEFYYRKRTGDWMPGRTGISIPIAMPIENAIKILTPLEDLLKVIDETTKALATMELADPEHEVYIQLKMKGK